MLAEKGELETEFEGYADAAASKLWTPEKPEALTAYHYTNEVGFRGIVESRTLRSTHADFMNDPTETKHALDLLAQVVLNESFTKELAVRDAPGKILWALERDAADRRFGTFIVSFSEHSDRLSQWRAYGDGGAGYALGFAMELGTSPFGESADVAAGISPPAAVRCIYDRGRQLATLTPFVEMFRKLDAHLESSDRHDEVIKLVLPHFVRLAVHYGVILKHPAYDEEKEVRLVSVTRAGSEPKPVVLFRNLPGPPIPYIAVNFSKPAFPMPLVSVVTGPKQRFGTAGVRLYLQSHWLPVAGDAVRPSSTPLR